MKSRVLASLLVCGMAMAPLTVAAQASAGADLTVIHEGVGAVPLNTYLGHLVSGVSQPGVLPGTTFPLVTRLQPGALLGDMPAGVFDPRWLAHPIFVIGADERSARWLDLNRQTLAQLGASGIVIEAPTEFHFKQLQALAGTLLVAPARGQWLEKTLLEAKVSAYPFVVMPDGRITQAPASAVLASPQSEGAR